MRNFLLGPSVAPLCLFGLTFASQHTYIPSITAKSVVELGRSTAADGTHFWFPTMSVSFNGGSTVGVRVQLGDDGGASCRPPTCHLCRQPRPCTSPTNESRRMFYSIDAGLSWTDGRSGVHVNGFETFPISLGTMLLNPTEVLALGALGPVAPSPPRSARSAMQQWAGGASTPPHPPTTSASFAAVGHKLFLNADGSFSNANASHNVVMDGFPASLRIGQIIRWCAVKTIRSDPASPLFAEVVQLELLDRTDSTATMPPPLLPPRALDTEHNPPKHRDLVFTTSNDNFTFSYVSTIARSNDPIFANTTDGPCESAVVQLMLPPAVASKLRKAGLLAAGVDPATMLLTVFRVGATEPYFHSVSLDLGGSWTTPEQLPEGIGSVRPQMHAIRTGNTDAAMLVGGRPGLMAWFGAVRGVTLRDGGGSGNGGGGAGGGGRGGTEGPGGGGGGGGGEVVGDPGDDGSSDGRYSKGVPADQGLGFLYSSTTLSPSVSIDWGWSDANLAAAHNTLVQKASQRFPFATVNRSDYDYVNTTARDVHVAGTTAYTSLIPVTSAAGSDAAPNSSRFVLVYDRLAAGWRGPLPGTDQTDAVFAMQLEVVFT